MIGKFITGTTVTDFNIRNFGEAVTPLSVSVTIAEA